MGTLENLPKEMKIQILSRLPRESLFQFKYVSKFWNALIKDPKYSSLLQHKHILFQRVLIDEDSGKNRLTLSILTLNSSMYFLDDFHLPLPMDWNKSPWPFPCEDTGLPLPFDDDPDYYKNFNIQNHSHGLVCLTKNGRDIILCNPTTREIQKLPPSMIALSDPLDYIYFSNGNSVGCGYDPKSRDFKVIRLVCFHPTSYYLKGEIYDLSKDRWREIEVPDMLLIQIDPSFGIWHEGTYYWASDIDERPFIHSFDLSEEVFDKIWLPESIEYCSYEDHMEILNGSIFVFHYTRQDDELDMWKLLKLDIWKMEKDEKLNDVSWSIISTIDLVLYGIEKALMFVNKDQLLITDEGGQILLYNIKTLEFKEFPLKDEEYYSWVSNATYFGKTLLSAKGGN